MSADVLLLDYEPRSIARIRGLLQTLGVQVILATDGPTGIREFERSRPDLTLVQDLLPKKHGFDVCRELKATPLGKERPIVLLAFVRPGKWRAVRSSGCDDCIEKPFDDLTLLNKVQRFLTPNHEGTCDAGPNGRRGVADIAEEEPAVVSFGDVEEIDAVLNELLAHGETTPASDGPARAAEDAASDPPPPEPVVNESVAPDDVSASQAVTTLEDEAPKKSPRPRARNARKARGRRRSRARVNSLGGRAAPRAADSGPRP